MSFLTKSNNYFDRYQQSFKKVFKSVFDIQYTYEFECAKTDLNFWSTYTLLNTWHKNRDVIKLLILLLRKIKSKIYIFLTQIYFCILEIFKTNVSNLFCVQNHLLNLCSCAFNSQRFFEDKKLVWNVYIKDFWYRNII